MELPFILTFRFDWSLEMELEGRKMPDRRFTAFVWGLRGDRNKT